MTYRGIDDIIRQDKSCPIGYTGRKAKTVRAAENFDFSAFARKVYDYRMRNGLSLERFAKKAGVNLRTVFRLEHGDERLSMNSIYKMELAMEDGKKGDFEIWNCK